MKTALLTIIQILALASFAIAQHGDEPIVTSDLLKMKTVSDLAISPDGQQVAFIVTKASTNDKKEPIYTRNIWITDVAGITPPVQLTYGNRQDRSPIWSPDGSKLAFIRAYEEKPQIWILPLSGGEAFVLTHAENGASNPQWSPDGNKILFSSSIPMYKIEGDLPWTYQSPGRTWSDTPNYNTSDTIKDLGNPDGNIEEVRKWLAKNASDNNPRVLDRLDLQGENDLEVNPSFSHLFVTSFNVEDSAVQITRGFQNFSSASWSADGKQIICTSIELTKSPDEEMGSNIWTMNADGSNAIEFFKLADYRLGQPTYSPDGKHIAFTASSLQEITYAQNELYMMTATGENATWLTETFDRDVSDYKWSVDGAKLYFNAPSHGYFPLFELGVKKLKITSVGSEKTGIQDFAIGEKNIIYAATKVENPSELYRLDIKKKEAVTLTTFNAEWLNSKNIVQPQEFTVTGPNGDTIDYWIMEPARKQEGVKYPTVLEMHGGPSAMWGPGEASMWQEFQLLCSWGYGVVYANPRGSGGYGDKFRKANYRDWGRGPTGDLMAALENSYEKVDWIDTTQLVITGGSYAGYLTAWIVSQDNRFKAAVAQRGVYDLSFFFGEGNAWRLVPNHFGGYPWEAEARKSMDENSPQTYVADINTPLLIIHSDKDLRTGVRQSEMLYKSLKVLGKPVEYVRYPDEGHELSRSGNLTRRMDRLNRIVEFFERFVEHPEDNATGRSY